MFSMCTFELGVIVQAMMASNRGIMGFYSLGYNLVRDRNQDLPVSQLDSLSSLSHWLSLMSISTESR